MVQAGALTWSFAGPGGNCEYWPEGFDGPMFMEQLPFGNVAIMADEDRLYHRLGRLASQMRCPRPYHPPLKLPGTGEAWAIVEEGETRARYPSSVIRINGQTNL